MKSVAIWIGSLGLMNALLIASCGGGGGGGTGQTTTVPVNESTIARVSVAIPQHDGQQCGFHHWTMTAAPHGADESYIRVETRIAGDDPGHVFYSGGDAQGGKCFQDIEIRALNGVTCGRYKAVLYFDYFDYIDVDGDGEKDPIPTCCQSKSTAFVVTGCGNGGQ